MKIIKKITILIMGIHLLSANDKIQTNSHQELEFNFNNPNKITAHFKIGDIAYSILNIDGQEYVRLNLDNSYNSSVKGAPELPQLNNLIEIPHGATPKIEIIYDDFIEFDLDSYISSLVSFEKKDSK